VFASFLILLYREGLPGVYPALFIGGIALFVSSLLVPAWIILLVLVILAGLLVLFMPIYMQRDLKTYFRLSGAIALIMTLALLVDWVVNNVLKEHQRNRIRVLIDPGFDPR
jgi:rod shape determining protein RodA